MRRGKIDELDKKILSFLQRNAREPFARIARELGVSEGTIHTRVTKMIERRIIEGFYTKLVPERIGKGLSAIVFIRADPTKGREVLSAASTLKDVYEAYEVTGEYFAALKVRTKDVESLRNLLDSISKIEGVVSTYTSIILRTLKEESYIEL